MSRSGLLRTAGVYEWNVLEGNMMELGLTENISRQTETQQAILTRSGECASAVGEGEELRVVSTSGSLYLSLKFAGNKEAEMKQHLTKDSGVPVETEFSSLSSFLSLIIQQDHPNR